MSAPRSTLRGRAAEARVAAWLEARGWVILARNLRVGPDEIDLLAMDGEVLVCVEVRARRPGALVGALASLTLTKRQRLRRAALRLAAEREVRALRVDVAAVTGDEIELVEAAIDFSGC
jgi:putative endonuclease